jgi:hypothetical protein
MRKAAAYAAGIPLLALAIISIVWVVWNDLIRADILPNASLSWFTTVAVVWGCLCIAVGGLLYYRQR